MKNLLVFLTLAFMVSCCAPVDRGNPDDSIDRTNKEVVEKVKMCTITLFYQDGTTKEIVHPWDKVYLGDDYIKIKYEKTYFVHSGRYDAVWDR